MPDTRNLQQETQQYNCQYDVDWLRVLAVLLLIYFHAAAVFYQGDLGEFYIQNDRPSHIMNLYFSLNKRLTIL